MLTLRGGTEAVDRMGIVVDTTYGRIEGVQTDTHLFFRGIPYAAPPLGQRRFRPPEPPEPWPGIRVCTEFGCAPPQAPGVLPDMAGGPTDEDCLFLNVYTPVADAGRRPVMVWIHGGGFTTGSAAQAMFDGGQLCARGDLVVVTLNHRLGALGYLHLPDLEDAGTNLAQLDQIAALEWVRDNIEAFGGDPSSVTIFGQSAGGVSVSVLLAIPAARGLFHRAIAQSGAASLAVPRHVAVKNAGRLMDELSVDPGDSAKLREIPAEKLIVAQESAFGRWIPTFGLPALAPVIDLELLPGHPLETIREGSAWDIPLLVGSNRDEAKLFTVRREAETSVDEEQVLSLVRGLMPRAARGNAERIIEAYRTARASWTSTEPADLLNAIASDRSYRIPSILLAEAQGLNQSRTYKYLFTWESPAMGGRLGACHALELPFVFGTLDAPTIDRFAGAGPEAEALSRRVMDAWIAFARCGDPSHPGLPAWPAYLPAHRATMLFGRECELVNAPLEEERLAWEGVL
jgi:para-nitrobenzyl esterase